MLASASLRLMRVRGCPRREEEMFKSCITNRSCDAIDVMEGLLAGAGCCAEDPMRHMAAGAAVITAFFNAGGKINGGTMTKGAALKEYAARAEQIPACSCETWCCCGAAVGVGQALSVINGATPMTREPWGQCQRLTATVQGHIAEAELPRCCSRSSYIAVLDAIDFLNEHFNVRMVRPERVTCTSCGGNAQCLREQCPYFPGE